MGWLVLLGSLAFGIFVGAAAVLFMHPAIRKDLSLGERNKQFGVFLGIVVVGGGGGAAGLTFLASPEAAGAYLLGVFIGGVVLFFYEERRAKKIGDCVRRATSHPEDVKAMLRGEPPADDTKLQEVLDELCHEFERGA